MFNRTFIKNIKFYPFEEHNKKNKLRKTFYILLILILFVGVSLPFAPLYVTIGIISVFLLILALVHEYLLLFLLIISFGTVLRVGEGFLPMSFAAAELVTYFLVFLYFRDMIQIDEARLFKEPILFAFFIFLFTRIIFATIHLPKDPIHMLSIIRDSFVPMLSVLVSLVMVRKFGVKKVLLCWIAVGILFAILGILQSNTGKFFFFRKVGERQRDYLEILISGTIGMGRSCIGLFKHPNTYGLYMQQILMLAVAMYLFSKKELYRILFLMISGILLIAIFYTYSRGGYVSTFLSIIVLMLLFSKKTRIVGISLIILTIFFFIKMIIPYFFKYYEQFETLIGRFYVWRKGLNVLKSNPLYILYGVGPGNFMKRAGTIFTAHNVYLLYIVEMGFFVLLALLYFIFTWLKHLWLNYLKTKDTLGKVLYLALFSSSIGYFIHEFIEHSFDSIIFLSIWAFWVGLISQYENINKETMLKNYGKLENL